MKKAALVFLCCTAFLVFGAWRTWAAQMCVSSAAALQTALTTAQSNGEDNVIMVVQGTYQGNFTYNSVSGKSLTLAGGYTAGCTSLVLNPTRTILDGNQAGTVLSLYDSNGGNISVEEFTIQHGNTTGHGGGVRAESASGSGLGGAITLTWNIFAGNTTYSNGGGVYANSSSNSGTGGPVVLLGNTFKGNNAYANGGGVMAQSTSDSGMGGPVTFTWNTFTGNTADTSGGVYASSYGQTGSGEISFFENTITGNYAYTQGGGVYAFSGSNLGTVGEIFLQGNTIKGNTAYTGGGGVFAESNSGSGPGGLIFLLENTITGNYAYAMQGGGVYASSFSDSNTGGFIALVSNTISKNTSYSGGGGVYANSITNSGTTGAIDLTANTISGNTAYGANGGAGVSISSNSYLGTGSTITLTGNTVANNHAYGDAGGVYCQVYTTSGTTGAVTFEANAITGNIAHDSYGGVYAQIQAYSSGTTGAVTFTNNIIAANTSLTVGGVYVNSNSSSGTTGPVILTNNTITKNSSLQWIGGVEVVLSNNTFDSYNNIIWGNTGPSPADLAVYGTGTANGYNNDYHDMSGNWNGGSAGNIDLDPLFDAGGHYHLTSLSPCINKGDNSVPSLPITDIDGNSRVISGTVDIGAHEYDRFLIATSPDDGSSFGGESLINKYQPTFQWIAVEPPATLGILFSSSPTDFSTLGVLISNNSVPTTSGSWIPSITTWKKIMTSSYNGGAPRSIYWKVVGTKADKSTAETPVRQFIVAPAFPPIIQSPEDGAVLPTATPPVFQFYTEGNVKFTLQISSLIGFTDPKKIISYNYSVTNPNVTPILMKTLSLSQWNTVKALIGVGGTGYFRIRAWDGINRVNDSPIQSFIIQ